MQRPTGVAAVAVFSAIVMGLFARSPYAEAGGNCEAKLAGKSYNCSWVVSDGPSFTECDEFVTGGHPISSISFFPVWIGAAHVIQRALPSRHRSTVLRAPLSAHPPLGLS